MADETTLEERVAALEEWQAMGINAEHILNFSAEQIDAFFTLLSERVFTSGRKTVEVTDNNTAFQTVSLTPSELGVTNITDDIRVIFTVHKAGNAVSSAPYTERYGTSVFIDSTTRALCLKFGESGWNTAMNTQAKLTRGTYYVDWLRIG